MTRGSQWLLYGATGYTGELIAEHAVARGLRPVLAGRDAERLARIGRYLGLEWQAVGLDDAEGLQRLVRRFPVVLHAAGPFAMTYEPMVQACLAARTHYLDLTGEIAVYEALAERHHAALERGIMLLPGVGFDMVPGDCLALHLKRCMPDAIRLDMGISFEGTMSRGTIRSALQSLSPAVHVRRDHALITLTEPLSRTFDFGSGPCGGVHSTYAIDFGDLSVAWRTTDIPNITSYLRPTKEMVALAALKSEADVAALPPGPTTEELRDLPAILVAEVTNAAGHILAARLVTPQIYAITATVATDIAQRVAEGASRPGFRTAASIFGEDYILDFEGCHLSSHASGGSRAQASTRDRA